MDGLAREFEATFDQLPSLVLQPSSNLKHPQHLPLSHILTLYPSLYLLQLQRFPR